MATESNRMETFIGSVILVAIAAIALGVFLEQFRFDPALFTATAPKGESLSAGVSGSSGLEEYMPEGMMPLTPLETFEPDDLSDKINGKAELYLSAGFISLQCRRFFSNEKAPDAWVELFVYDMGSMRNAFSVFSAQRRADAEKLDLTRFSYKTSNALFFVHGQDYVEIVAAAEGMSEVMLSIGQNIVKNKPAAMEQLDESSLFPPEHLDEGSVSLRASDVFGFSGLSNVFTAKYTLAGTRVTAFLSKRETPQNAIEMAEAYGLFLLENGGTDLESDVDIPGARLIQIFDTFELIFSHENLLAGVHEAESKAEAEELALILYRRLQRVDK